MLDVQVYEEQEREDSPVLLRLVADGRGVDVVTVDIHGEIEEYLIGFKNDGRTILYSGVTSGFDNDGDYLVVTKV